MLNILGTEIPEVWILYFAIMAIGELLFAIYVIPYFSRRMLLKGIDSAFGRLVLRRIFKAVEETIDDEEASAEMAAGIGRLVVKVMTAKVKVAAPDKSGQLIEIETPVINVITQSIAGEIKRQIGLMFAGEQGNMTKEAEGLQADMAFEMIPDQYKPFAAPFKKLLKKYPVASLLGLIGANKGNGGIPAPGGSTPSASGGSPYRGA